MKTPPGVIALGRAFRVSRPFWVFSFALYIGAFVIGRMTAQEAMPHLFTLQRRSPAIAILSPSKVTLIRQTTEERWRFSRQIYFHNVTVTGFNCFLGLLLFPVHCLAAASLAYICGVTLYLDESSVFLARILPHGILEIPAMLLTTAASVQAGYRLYCAPWKGKLLAFKEGMQNLSIVWVVLALWLLPAALLEGFGRVWISNIGGGFR